MESRGIGWIEVVQPGEEKAPGGPHCGLSIYKRGLEERQ